MAWTLARCSDYLWERVGIYNTLFDDKALKMREINAKMSGMYNYITKKNGYTLTRETFDKIVKSKKLMNVHQIDKLLEADIAKSKANKVFTDYKPKRFPKVGDFVKLETWDNYKKIIEIKNDRWIKKVLLDGLETTHYFFDNNWIFLDEQPFKTSNNSKSEPVGYHLTEIKKGELGQFSKIQEEFEELDDAIKQNNPVMALVELTDLLGAIEAYSSKNYNIDLEQLLVMTRATQRAFKNGHRN